MSKNIGLIMAIAKAVGGSADPAVIEQAVTDWLNDHPEATTTVEDGSITEAKLAADVLAELGEIDGLKEAIASQPEQKDSTATGIDLDVSDEDGNVILRLANGNIKTKYFDSQKENPQIITVSTTIRAAVAAAISAGASKGNPFVIQIPAGSYNILSEFTSEEIAESGFIGLLVDDGITLEGMGISRQQTVLYAEMDTTTYDQTKRNDVSTINLRGNVGLKNLTVKAKNIRYAVHDDKSFTSSEPKVRIIQNCAFFAESTTSGGYGNISFGAGTDGRKVFIFKECDFGDLVHIHTNTNAYPNLVIMENCKGYGLTATDYAASADSHYYLYGCDFSWIRVDKGANWASQHLFIHGTNRGTMVGGWDGMEYETGDTIRVQHPYSISSDPVAVAMRSASRYHIQPATGADDTIGICFRYDSTNDYAIVQKTGWVCAELLGFASPTIGNYLIVGSDGALSLSASDSGAIGKVFCANDAGEHFIKLSI